MRVKVRIAVVYSADSRWRACGWARPPRHPADGHDLDMVYEAGQILRDLDDAGIDGHHFVEAEIEIPDPVPVVTVAGKVVDG